MYTSGRQWEEFVRKAADMQRIEMHHIPFIHSDLLRKENRAKTFGVMNRAERKKRIQAWRLRW